MKRFIKEYRLELAAALAVLLGIFLLVEQLDIRQSIRASISAARESASAFFQVLGVQINDYLLKARPSDLIGAALIVGMLIFIIWRIRHRFAHDSTWTAKVCPKCGQPIVRIHRSRLDRILTWAFFPQGYRYACKNKDCRWSGIRRRNRHSIQDLETISPE